MRRIFRIAGWIVLGLVVAFALAFAWGRWRPVSVEVRDATALMRQDLRPADGREVWPLLWLYDVDLPPEKVDAVYRGEVAYFTRRFADERMPEHLASPAEASFGLLAKVEPGEMKLLCAPAMRDCIAYTKEHAEAIAGTLRKHAERLRRTRAILGGDSAWNTMPISPFMPFPVGLNQKRLSLNDAALDFVQGRRAEALQKVCDEAAGWRRLHRHTNTLVSSMVFASYARQAGQLFSQMLAEVPDDDVLPGECATAFSPPSTSDVDQCAAMQSELAYVSTAMHWDGRAMNTWDRMLGWILFDREKFIGRIAVTQAGFCRSAHLGEVLRGHDLTDLSPWPSSDIFDWLSNNGGMVFAGMGVPAYNDYGQRMQDYATSLRMLATVLWLRETRTDGRPLAERFATRPAAIRSEGVDDIVLAADGRSLGFRQRKVTSSGPELATVPLPAGL